MKVRPLSVRVGVGVCAVLLAVTMAWVRAEDKPAAASDAKPAKKPTATKLVQPWSKMKTLNDEQKGKIKEIHAAAVAQINAIREKEESDIVALLNDEQKAELKTIQEQNSAAKKAAAPKKDAPAAE